MLLQLLITLLTTLVINFLLIKFNLLLDLEGKFEHKSLAKSKKIVPLSGGLVLFALFNYFYYQDYILFISSFLILFLGLCSDIDFLRSPKIRIFIQTCILFFFISSSKLYFTDLRADVLDFMLNIYLLGLFFNIFCYLVLINGTNLIDGLNSIVLGYYISITFILFIICSEYTLIIDVEFLKTITSILIIIYLLNLFGKVFMGDSGSYLLSFIFGVFLIKFYVQNPSISPYFIMCLLWYPAFENLFSIFRKSLNKISFQKPDNKHLHQYIYIFLEKKFKFKKEITNSITGNIIVFYNLVYFLMIKDYYFYTTGLILSVIVNIFIYISTYYFLSKKLFSN